MIAYGQYKRTHKIHPHNECAICSEFNIVKKRERQRSKKDVDFEVSEINAGVAQ